MTAYTQQPIAMLRALRGAPVSVLIALRMASRPLGLPFLIAATGYKKNVVSDALHLLAEMHLAMQTARYNGWQLLPAAGQLPLFEAGVVNIEGDLITLAGSSSSLINAREEDKELLLLQSGRVIKSPSPTDDPLSDAALAATDLLSRRTGYLQTDAEKAVRSALAHWYAPGVEYEILRWLEFVRRANGHAKQRGINNPGAYIGSRIAICQAAPDDVAIDRYGPDYQRSEELLAECERLAAEDEAARAGEEVRDAQAD